MPATNCNVVSINEEKHLPQRIINSDVEYAIFRVANKAFTCSVVKLDVSLSIPLAFLSSLLFVKTLPAFAS